ncbi:hypothetical protein [Paenibacillus sp. FSL R7-0333]|uniref:hypothetical protein n=1 Tax=Paenibacillus sp. FSL R7-0333 TaxID=1926587 RepID=UPI00096CA12C|nr:hypothetical protein BK146_17820 [Paenibacillus sp. FSL R7-0333]
MTQVKEWSNQELNRRLAELMGYTVIDFSYADDPDNYDYFKVVNEAGEQFGEDRDSEEEAWDEVPNYSGNAAASLEVQTAAIVKDPENFMRNLVAVRWDRQDAAEMKELSLVGAADLHLASPRERAEAAYITLSQVLKSQGADQLDL